METNPTIQMSDLNRFQVKFLFETHSEVTCKDFPNQTFHLVEDPSEPLPHRDKIIIADTNGKNQAYNLLKSDTTLEEGKTVLHLLKWGSNIQYVSFIFTV